MNLSKVQKKQMARQTGSDFVNIGKSMNDSLHIEEISDQNISEYELFLKDSKSENLFQSTRWGLLKSLSGWFPQSYLFRNEREGKIVGTVLLLKKNLPLLDFCILYAPRGPILDFSDHLLYSQVLEALKKISQLQKAILLKLNPNVPATNSFVMENLIQLTGGLSPNPSMHSITMRLSVQQNDEDLQAHFDPRARTALRKAIKDGVQIEEANSPESLKKFFEILAQTSQRKDFYIPSLSLIQQVHEIFVQTGFGKIYLARDHEEYLAGACFLRTSGECRYMWGGSLPQKRNLNPNHLIQWTAIKWARDCGCQFYDFQGVDRSKDDAKTKSGSYFFKSSFGGEEVKFVGEYDLVIKPWLYRSFLWLEPKYRKILSLAHRMKWS